MRPRPHTAAPSPVTPQPAMMPLPAVSSRGTSNPRVSIAPTTSLPISMAEARPVEREPEPFVSPTDFALFAEATSSFSFLPSTFDVMPSRAPSPPRLYAPPYLTTSYSNTLPSRHLIPLPQLITPRSRSVPANPVPTHHRSSSSSTPMPMLPLRRSSPPQQSLPPAPYVPRQPPRQPSRSQLLAQALEGIVDDDNINRGADDELPDYATSQAEASARQRGEAARRARELEENWRRGRAERTRRPWRGGF